MKHFIKIALLTLLCIGTVQAKGEDWSHCEHQYYQVPDNGSYRNHNITLLTYKKIVAGQIQVKDTKDNNFQTTPIISRIAYDDFAQGGKWINHFFYDKPFHFIAGRSIFKKDLHKIELNFRLDKPDGRFHSVDVYYCLK